MGLLSKTTPEIEDALRKADDIETAFDTMFDTKFDTKFESEFNTNFNTKFDSEFDTKFTQKMLSIYPVGAIYMSVSNTSPASLFGGTWEQIQNRFLLAAGSSYTAGNTGGASTVTLTTSQIPSHRHEGIFYFENIASKNISLNSGSTGYRISWTAKGGNGTAEMYTNYTGGGAAHDNMPPYLVVYVWKRTA